LLHTIAQPGPPVPTNPWITRYIFPGGHIPALSEITPAIERAGLIIADVEVLRLHYAMTLAHWRARFQTNRAAARALYGERFCRMWEFYLAGAECAFRFENEHVLHIQLVKNQDAVPIARDYIGAREARLAAREQEFAVKAFEPVADDLPRVAGQAGFVRARRIV
jgi:cyclopropane-fatty-acyl-phospholipid synthase